MIKKKKKSFLWILFILAASLAAACLILGVHGVKSGGSEEGRRQLEDTLRKAAVVCYATEGIYPPNLSYLETHYGVRVDAQAYTVYYDVFADNMMPDITVLLN